MVYDESLAGLGLMLAKDAGGNISPNANRWQVADPFAPKTRTEGDLSHSDFDDRSELAISDFTGGMGQFRYADASKYATGRNIDSRAERLVLGPRVHLDGSTLAHKLYKGDGTGALELAENPESVGWDFLSGPASPIVKRAGRVKATGTSYSRCYLGLKSNARVDTQAVVTVRKDMNGLPNLAVAPYVTVDLKDVLMSPTGLWAECVFPSSITVTVDETLWVCVEYSGNVSNAVGLGRLYNINAGVAGADNDAYQYNANTQAWTPAGGTQGKDAYLIWMNPDTEFNRVPIQFGQITTKSYSGIATAGGATDITDSAATFGVNALAGASIRLVGGTGAWTTARTIVSNTATVITVNTAWDVNPAAGSLYVLFSSNFGPDEDWTILLSGKHLWRYRNQDWGKVTGGDLGGIGLDMVLFQPTAANSVAQLYIAVQGADMKRWNLDPSYTFITLTGIQAHKLCVHDALLWKSYDNEVAASEDGATFSTQFVAVGGRNTRVKQLFSWNGKLYAAKVDGLWEISYEDTYPATGKAIANKVLDFYANTHRNNFAATTQFQGDLYFPIQYGLLRFTAGGVLQRVNPEASLQGNQDTRGFYTSLHATNSTLYAGLRHDFTGYSAILAYDKRGWHPMIQSPRKGDLLPSLWVDPGSNDYAPRLWMTFGLQIGYANIPQWTNARYQATGMDYVNSGSVEFSWYDAGLQDVMKVWQDVTVITSTPQTTSVWVQAEYALDNDPPTYNLLSINTVKSFDAANVRRYSFPEGTAGNRLKLRITLYGGGTDTPQVLGVVMQYNLKPRRRLRFSRIYIVGDEQRTHTGQMPKGSKELIAQLQALRNHIAPVSFVDIHKNSYLVNVLGISGLTLEVKNDNDQHTRKVERVVIDMMEAGPI